MKKWQSGNLRPAALGLRDMTNNTRLTFTGRIRSIYCALNGIAVMLMSQRNAWVHAVATIAVTVAGFYCGLTKSEWCWIVLSIIAVWTAEALNTAFEFLTDVASPEFHPLAGKAKDVAAGAVLISAIGSVIIGLIIFGPHVLALTGGCNLFHRHIESVIDIEIESDTSIVQWGDTVSIRYKIINKTNGMIEICDTPGFSVDLAEISVWEIRNTERPKNDMVRFPWLRPAYYSTNKFVDTPLYLSIEPGNAITGTRPFSFTCTDSDTKTIEIDTWMVDIWSSNCDTGTYILKATFESRSTGKAQGHNAAIGWTWTKKPLIFTVLEKRRELRRYINPYFEENDEDTYKPGPDDVVWESKIDLSKPLNLAGVGLVSVSRDIVIDTETRENIYAHARQILYYDSSIKLPDTNSNKIALVEVKTKLIEHSRKGDFLDAIVFPCSTDADLRGAILHETPLEDDCFVYATAKGTLSYKKTTPDGKLYWIPGGVKIIRDPKKVGEYAGKFKTALFDYETDQTNLKWLERGISNILKFDVLEVKKFALIDRSQTCQRYSDTLLKENKGVIDLAISGKIYQDGSNMVVETILHPVNKFFRAAGDTISFKTAGDPADMFSLIEKTGYELKTMLKNISAK